MICASRNVQVPRVEVSTTIRVLSSTLECLTRRGQGEEEPLEETRRLVEAPLEAVEQMNIELLVLVYVLADTLQDDHFHEALDDQGLGRDKDPRRSIASVRTPRTPC